MIAVVLVVAAMNPVNIDHVRIDIQEIKRKVKEIVVISGKGGTGKTSIVASFASLLNAVRIFTVVKKLILIQKNVLAVVCVWKCAVSRQLSKTEN